MSDTGVLTTPPRRVAIMQRSPKARAYTVRKATDLHDFGTVIAVYGPPGVGKTPLAGQACYSEHAGHVLHVDCEGGSRSISHMPNISVARVYDTNDRGMRGFGFDRVAREILDDLWSGELRPDEEAEPGPNNKFGTVIVDNMSEINAMCVYHVLRTVGRNVQMQDRPDQKDWNTTTNEMLSLTRRWRDFAQATNTNVIFIAWDRSQEDRVTGMPKKDLAFNPALANQFPGMIDVVAYLTFESGKEQRRKLLFEPSLVTATRIRRNDVEVANSIPGEFTYVVPTAAVPKERRLYPMADLISCLKGGVPFPAGKYGQSSGGLLRGRVPAPSPNVVAEATTDVSAVITGQSAPA